MPGKNKKAILRSVLSKRREKNGESGAMQISKRPNEVKFDNIRNVLSDVTDSKRNSSSPIVPAFGKPRGEVIRDRARKQLKDRGKTSLPVQPPKRKGAEKRKEGSKFA